MADEPKEGTEKTDEGKDGKGKKIAKAVKKGLDGIADTRREATDRMSAQNPGIPNYRKGGRVKKTGLVRAHKNEEVVRPEEADKVRRFLKKGRKAAKAPKRKSKRSNGREM